MIRENVKTNTSLLGGLSLTLLGTTCCALPIALVTLGLGGTVASVVTALPGLAWLSQYKLITFSVTALLLAYSWWRLRSPAHCGLTSARQRKWQRRILTTSTLLFILSLFAAYALLPMVRWLASA